MNAFSQRLQKLSAHKRQLLQARLLQRGLTPPAASTAAKQLVAYVVPHTTEMVTPTELRDFLSPRLPSYMLPAQWAILPALPLTPNGKVDRKALPDPAQVEAEPSADLIAPRNEFERAVAAVWQELLGGDFFDVRDNVFELGGHSLLVAQMAARLQNQFQVQVPVSAFFEAPTLEGMAARLAAARLLAPTTNASDEEREDIEL
jgi:hypothetical protein